MSVMFTNSRDLVANSVSITKGNQVFDLLETINSVQGLAPSTLNSLEKLASAMDNNPSFNSSVMQAIDQKADLYYVNTQLSTKAASSLVYTKTEADNKLALKADQSTTFTKDETTNLLNTTKAYVDTQLATKASSSLVYTKTDTDDKLNLSG